LQQTLREVEKSVSGALFLLLQCGSTEAKTSLRAALTAAVCYELEQHGIVSRSDLSKQLSPTQLSALEKLEARQPNESCPVEYLRVAKLLAPLAGVDVSSDLEQVQAQLTALLQLSCRYATARLRNEPEPPLTDWGRRDIEFRERLQSLASGPSFRVKFEEARFEVLDGDTVKGEAALEVLGLYRPEQQSYEAGWGARSVPAKARPLPVLGCASQLFRIDALQAQSEAQRCASLSKAHYLFEYTKGDSVFFLGLSGITEVKGASTSAFSEDDVRPEVLAVLRELEQSLSSRTPERLCDLFRSHSQALSRRLSLFEEGSGPAQKLDRTAQTLADLGKGIKTRSFFGSGRDQLGRRERSKLATEIEQLRSVWAI